MRVTASYLYEGLVAEAIEPYAADRDGVSAVGLSAWDLRRAIYQLRDVTQHLTGLDRLATTAGWYNIL